MWLEYVSSFQYDLDIGCKQYNARKGKESLEERQNRKDKQKNKYKWVQEEEEQKGDDNNDDDDQNKGKARDEEVGGEVRRDKDGQGYKP